MRREILRTCLSCGVTFTRRHFRDLILDTGASTHQQCSACYLHPDEELVGASPAHLLPPVRVPRSRPRPTPETAYRAARMRADARVGLAVELAGRCGLRRGEVARARGEDLEADLAGWSLRVVGKGGHVRVVPLPDDLAARIRERGPGWLFPTARGDAHLTAHHLSKLVSRCLPAGITMHSLRHRCATVAYAQTRDLRAVQELLGHSRPETTAAYTLAPDESIRAAMQAAAA